MGPGEPGLAGIGVGLARPGSGAPRGRGPRNGDEGLTDADLLSRCRRGDGAAWDSLVKRYQTLVYSVAMRNGLDSQEAADVTQTTFVALLNSIDGLREEARLASWLMTVARRQSWRMWRRREKEQGREPVVIDVRDPIDDWERAAVVYEALQRLCSDCRALLVALYFDPSEPSYSKIAKRLGRSVGGIGPMRGRCLQQLRDLIDEEALG